MENITILGIILSVSDWKEKDKLCSLFTTSRGLVQVKFVGVKNNNAKLKAYALPFCFGEFDLSGKSEILTVTSVKPIDTFFDLTYDYDKYLIACDMLKLVKMIASINSEPNIELFTLFTKCLGELCYSNTSKYIIYIKFLLSILNISGFSINTLTCSECGKKIDTAYLNIEQGNIVCTSHVSENCLKINSPSLKAINLIDSLDYDKLSSLKISDDILKDTIKILQLDIEARLSYKF
jgi:DNA repair protein RecO (recombination protein O)